MGVVQLFVHGTTKKVCKLPWEARTSQLLPPKTYIYNNYYFKSLRVSVCTSIYFKTNFQGRQYYYSAACM